MSELENKKFTVAEFFEAVRHGENRYELVDGVAEALVRARQGHSVIRTNVLSAFVPAAKTTGCRATSVNTGVRTGPGTIRYPDVVVDCGVLEPKAMTASKPTIIAEIIAGTVPAFDRSVRLQEYLRLESVESVIQIAAETIKAKVHLRKNGSIWTDETFMDLDDDIHLPALSTTISRKEIYDSLSGIGT